MCRYVLFIVSPKFLEKKKYLCVRWWHECIFIKMIIQFSLKFIKIIHFWSFIIHLTFSNPTFFIFICFIPTFKHKRLSIFTIFKLHHFNPKKLVLYNTHTLQAYLSISREPMWRKWNICLARDTVNLNKVKGRSDCLFLSILTCRIGLYVYIPLPARVLCIQPAYAAAAPVINIFGKYFEVLPSLTKNSWI